MAFFTKLPWVNVLFSEETVMNVRARFRSDGAQSYLEAGIGEMSVRRFERLIENMYLQVKYRKYECVRKMTTVANVPLVRELFINHITVEVVPRQAFERS